MIQLTGLTQNVTMPNLKLTLIVFQSGSGKTTLLNALNFRTPKNLQVTGSIKINGIEVKADEVENYIGFVPQDDLFIGTLTVYEHLKFMVYEV